MKIISMNCGAAPTWLVSSVDGALHRYRKSHGFKFRTSLNFFQALFSSEDRFQIYFFNRSSHIWFLYIYSQNLKKCE